jgi:hypothetical protein
MKRLVEFPLQAGGTVVVEVDEPEPEGGTERAARPGEVVEKAFGTFEDALSTVRPTVEGLIAKLAALSDPPDQTEVEFGLKLTAKVGAVLASADAEANYKLKLTWKRTSQGS